MNIPGAVSIYTDIDQCPSIGTERESCRFSKVIRELLDGFAGVSSVYPFGESLHITLDDDRKDAGFVEAWLTRAGLTEVSIQAIEPGIEDAFLMMMTDTHKKSQS